MNASIGRLLLVGTALTIATPAWAQTGQSAGAGSTTAGNPTPPPPGASAALTPAATPTPGSPGGTGTPGAPAASAGGPATVGEIVVTAQKRTQSINSVGETITALTGSQLTQRGISSVADLTKAVPGFVYTPTSYGTPVFVLRGVGVYESGYGTSPAVAIYNDEVPVPYPLMQEGLGLDLERVEVLKGPQGTLFGENSTGGAINYISAKPTNSDAVGANITYARFGEVDGEFYASGPITDTLKGRIALAAQNGGAWQQSVSRPGDELGDRNFYQGRVLLDWDPTNALSVKLNLNGFYDNSQNQAPQLKSFPPSLLNPALPFPQANYAGNPNVPTNFFTGPLTPATTPKVAPNNDRAADWSTGWGGDRRNNDYIQGSLRADYKLNGQVTLTSISALNNVGVKSWVPQSGTGLPIENILSHGTIAAFNQEIRLTGATPRLNWVTGLGYAYTNSQEHETFSLPGILFSLFDFRGLDAVGVLPSQLAKLVHLNEDTSYTRQVVNDYSVFGNLDYKITDALAVQGGLRYTVDDRHAYSCEYYSDPANSDYGTAFEALQLLLGKSSYTPVGQGQCLVLNSSFTPSAIYNKLDQNNVSWRFALNYKVPGGGPLFYASASRGYKAGEITDIGASSASQYKPVPQERLDAYEGGVKAPLFDRRVQLNAALFYYDYKDKQVRGNEDDPIFGSLEQLISVPKSEIYGLDASLEAHPLSSLTTSLGITVLNSRVTSLFTAVTQNNVVGEFQGSQIPYTPHVTLNADGEYDHEVFGRYRGFIGASVLYHSVSNATFQTSAVPAPEFDLPSYVTLDLRAGVGTPDGRWRLTLFGRNVTNSYYLTGNYSNGNERFVYTGLPAVYGATLSFKY